MTKQDISHLAEVFAQAMGFTPGGEMTPLVDKLGGKIEYLPWEAWSLEGADSIKVFKEGVFTIFLSKIAGLFNNRFSIAHELGHYVLHSNMGERKIFAQRNYANSRVEWEANWFAASLLMPRKHFLKEAEKNSDPNVLAAKYLVSPVAANVRKKTLGI